MRWVEGRQGSGYFKLKILESKLFKFDIYLLKFPVDSYINLHTDPALPGYKHHRLNIVLKAPKKGGTFVLDGLEQKGRIHKFRPDIQMHNLNRIEEGIRYVLSIGWLKKK